MKTIFVIIVLLAQVSLLVAKEMNGSAEIIVDPRDQSQNQALADELKMFERSNSSALDAISMKGWGHGAMPSRRVSQIPRESASKKRIF